MLAEAYRFKKMFDARLILIHIGVKTEENEQYLWQLVKEAGVNADKTDVIWEQGKPAKKILSICERENIDLLLAGALKQENLYNYYVGSIARKILRKAHCSVMMLVDPSEKLKPFKEIVIDAEDNPFVHEALMAGMDIGRAEKSRQIHVLREIKLYGLAISVAVESTELEKSEIRRTMVNAELEKVNKKLTDIDVSGLKVNIKIIAGKSGFELLRFTKKVNADLMVVSDPGRSFDLFDRVFKHDLEFIFADLPCNLLIVKK